MLLDCSSIMEYAIYEFPFYTLEIVKQVRSADWLVHSFELSNNEDIYNPSGYLYNSEFFGKEYTIYLDLNVYQYVLSAYKKRCRNELHRNALALMVFGKFTNITFDPTLAIYEKLNYATQCPNEITEDLGLFRRIDNCDMDSLAAFALGHANEIELPGASFVDDATTKKRLTRYRRLRKWDSLYLMVLVIAKLYHLENCSNEEKIRNFLNWSHDEFGYSLVAIAFLISLLGNKPNLKLMKYKLGMNAKQKRAALVNMTWDLFLLDKFFEYWVKKPPGKEFLYASNDIPLRQVLCLAISIQLHGSCDNLADILSEPLIQELNRIPDGMKSKADRKAQGLSANDFQRYRNELITRNEYTLLKQSMV